MPGTLDLSEGGVCHHMLETRDGFRFTCSKEGGHEGDHSWDYNRPISPHPEMVTSELVKTRATEAISLLTQISSLDYRGPEPLGQRMAREYIESITRPKRSRKR